MSHASKDPSAALSGEELATLRHELAELKQRVSQLEAQAAAPQDRLSMVVFSGSLDKVLAAFMIATAAAASGMEVVMFFTFWGLGALRDPQKRVKKTLREQLFGAMIPRGTRALSLSQMNMGGLGARLVRHIMAEQHVASLEEMVELAAELNVKIYACDMSRALLGIKMEELISYPQLGACGAATFVERAAGGKVTLFI